MEAIDRPISGWSLTSTQPARVYRPEHRPEVPALLRQLRGSDAIARGAGTAYGDAALNDRVVDTRRLGRLLAFDPAAGRVRCEAGTSLRRLLELVVPRGWFLAVTPGTWKSTVGGCVACDVHGKNHHLAGSFGAQVREIVLALADGTTLRCSRDREPERFWATIGGLGLTGVILEVELQLQAVETSAVVARHLPSRDLDGTFAALEEEHQEPYAVAWLDVLARGRHLGRSVLHLGRHARREELPAPESATPLALSPGRSVRLPCALPAGVMSAPAVRAFNALYFRRHRAAPGPALVPLRPFFYPLEAIDNFPLLYGRRGLYEYQCVVPGAAAPAVLRQILEGLSARGLGSFLCVVKRLGPAGGGLLSFPAEGYTLAVDIPARGPELLSLLRTFDRLVADRGGRVYLAKDSRLDPGVVDAMYPRRRELAAWLDRWDPQRSFHSALARRLGLREGA